MLEVIHQPITSQKITANINMIDCMLAEIHREFRSRISQGVLADYIPELTQVNKDNFGIVLTTVDGYQYAYGDVAVDFTIQSVSKPFVYGMALQGHGIKKVLEKISVEPSGDAFNSISLFPDSGKPFNPMINAGAIAATGLIWELYGENTFHNILKTFSIYAGAQLTINEKIYRSESITGHRNRAISHLLRNFNILESDVEAPLDAYFKQCSINVDCRKLSLMGATLANSGINPMTSNKAIDAEYVPKVLGVMSTCGMYDYSGEWIYHVGLPAKSGVGGGVLAVLPGQLSIAVYSPLLDGKGNSVLGVEVCKKIADTFSLHLYKTPKQIQQVVRRHTTLETIRSRYKRDQKSENILQEFGHHTHLIDLQGGLYFAACELLMRKVPENFQVLILNLQKCNNIDDAAIQILMRLHDQLQSMDRHLYIIHYHHLELFAPLQDQDLSCFSFKTLDEVLFSCEEELLSLHGYRPKSEPVRLDEQQLLEGLSEEELASLKKHLTHITFKKGDTIIKKGSSADVIYFLEAGKVSILDHHDLAGDIILAVLSAGNSFGDMALVDKKPRSADVKAETDVSCSMMVFEILQEENLATIKEKIFRNLAASLSTRLRLANKEIAGFV